MFFSAAPTAYSGFLYYTLALYTAQLRCRGGDAASDLHLMARGCSPMQGGAPTPVGQSRTGRGPSPGCGGHLTTRPAGVRLRQAYEKSSPSRESLARHSAPRRIEPGVLVHDPFRAPAPEGKADLEQTLAAASYSLQGSPKGASIRSPAILVKASCAAMSVHKARISAVSASVWSHPTVRSECVHSFSELQHSGW